MAALLAIPTALFLWSYGPLFLPRTAPMPSPHLPMTVLTFNLGYANTHSSALAATLTASQADVLALQEVTTSHKQALDPVLVQLYPYRSYYAPSQLAIYSRYPVLDEQVLPMEPWPAQSVVIQAKTTTFKLINAHLAQVGIRPFLRTWDARPLHEQANARDAQVTQIQDTIRAAGLPAIVACDCNITDLMAAYGRITTTLQDTYRERGWGLGHTFLVPRGFEIPSTVNLPVGRLDYLFHSPAIRAVKVEVLSDRGSSDHLPLLALFDLKP